MGIEKKIFMLPKLTIRFAQKMSCYSVVLRYLFNVSQTNLNALEQSWLHFIQWCM